jgi:hypothetical protein
MKNLARSLDLASRSSGKYWRAVERSVDKRWRAAVVISLAFLSNITDHYISNKK